MNTQNKKPSKLNKIMIVLATVLLVAASGYGIFYAFFREAPDQSQEETNESPDIDVPNDGQGGSSQRPSDIDDTSGEDSTDDQDSDSDNSGVSSDSGAITLTNPSANGILGNDTTISGQAEVQNVSYRIIDDSRGMIAQGELAVSNGKFSAKINSLSPYGDSGVLQIFSIDPDTRQEENLVQVDVRFK